MNCKTKIYLSQSFSPYENIAWEKYITATLPPDTVALFLWQNADTIVIGRNQNVWKECRVSDFLTDGGKIARRLSGGGAVYHDIGNLNFTFAAHESLYSVPKQLSVIGKALLPFGVEALISGRNDLTVADGRKFSGNAFYSVKAPDGQGQNRCHHGCILISADTGRMAKFLNVSKEKLQSKGVASVRSRVVNLHALSDQITPKSLSESLLSAFAASYGADATPQWQNTDVTLLSSEDAKRIADDTAFFRSDAWLYGRPMDFTDSFAARFPFGSIECFFAVKDGTVADCRVYSDCMAETAAPALENAFIGCSYAAHDLSVAAERALASLALPEELSQEMQKAVSALLQNNI